jgi:alanyl-tRNA synthetase
VTERLYYGDGFLADFEGIIADVRPGAGGRTAVVLDRTAFYPDSGGQLCDTGTLRIAGLADLSVVAVEEDPKDGEILHLVEMRAGETVAPGARVSGSIDQARRHYHRQQHSGQHILSAAFIRLFGMATVSFHMGEAGCTIDLDAKALTEAQLIQAEELANNIVCDDRPVEIHWATPEEARGMGTRKIPPEVQGKLRLIEIRDFDLNACGGTHVHTTGQVGAILLRKSERVKQGMRVEFVCGAKAVHTVRRDYATLTEAAALFSTHLSEVPQQIRKTQEEVKAGQKERKKLLEELAELHAGRLSAQALPMGNCQLITWVFNEHDAGFVKLVAQKIVAIPPTAGQSTVALLGCSSGPQPALVFAQTPGGPYDMSMLMHGAVEVLGGRGGGNKDLAQGGAPAGADLDRVIAESSEFLAYG